MELMKDGKLTKEDYMRLPKERLAELLVERDNLPRIEYVPWVNPAPAPNTIPPYYLTCGVSTHPQTNE